MISWMKKAGRTRTPVDNAVTMQESRREGLRLARSNLCAILLAVQLLLWLALYCYDRQRQSTWQAALWTLLPLGIMVLLWFFAARKAPLTGKRAWAALLLIPCLWLDVFLCMASSLSLMEYYIPTFPFYGRLLMVILFPLIASWISKGSGIAYGLYPLKYVLLALFAFSTVLSGADVSLARIQPMKLLPLAQAGQALYGGAGAAWVVCLMFLVPAREGYGREKSRGKRRHWWIFVLIPVLAMLIWAFWTSMLRPWEPEDVLVSAQKLTAISRYSSSMPVSQLGTLLWTSVLPAAILGSLYMGQQLGEAAFPRIPRGLLPLLMVLPAAALLMLPVPSLSRWMEILLPLRWVPALAAGILLLFLPGKEKRQ